MIETGLSIGGHWVPQTKSFDRADPVTGEVVTRAAAATVEQANAAADAAVADALAARSDAFIDAMMGEIGATEGWARFNLARAIGIVREAAAIGLANDTLYGLSAAVFTRDTARVLRVARQIKSGICHVNGPIVHDEAQMPFGGTDALGCGRFGGKAGIDAFIELRWITIETQPGHYPI